MAFDWLSKSGSTGSESVDELIEKKKFGRALERLRADFAKGSRSISLRLQYADLLELDGKPDLAVPVLLGLAEELSAAGAVDRAIELLVKVLTLAPERTEVAAQVARLQKRAPVQKEKPSRFKAAVPVPAAPAPAPAREEPDPLLEVEFEAPPIEEGEEARAASPPLDEARSAAGFTPAELRGGLGGERRSTPPLNDELDDAVLTAAVAEAWDLDGEGADPEVTEGISIADVAEDAVAEAWQDKQSLVSYLLDLAERFAPRNGEKVGPGQLSSALFHGLSDAEVRAARPGLQRHVYDPGHAMVSEGEPGGGLFILARGRARVMVRSAHGRFYEVAQIEEGGFFGEISLFGRPRSATVVAIGRCEALEVETDTLHALVDRRPLAKEVLEEALLARASSSDAAAVRSVPEMDPDAPAAALAKLERHFNAKRWSPRMRLRLAELLAKVGNYSYVAPILVGIADELQTAGHTARAIAILKKLDTVPWRDEEESGLAVPSGPGATVVTYVVEGRPLPTTRAARQFSRWVSHLMRETKAPDAASSPLHAADASDLLEALAAEPNYGASPSKPSTGTRREPFSSHTA